MSKLNVRCVASHPRTVIVIKINREKYKVKADEEVSIDLPVGEYNAKIIINRGGLSLTPDKNYSKLISFTEDGQTESLEVRVGDSTVDIYTQFSKRADDELQPDPDQPVLTKEEFSRHPLVAKKLRAVNAAATAHMVLAVFHFVCAFLMPVLYAGTGIAVNGWSYAIPGALLLGLGLGIRFGKSRVCAIISLCQAVINAFLSILMGGTVISWVPIAFGIWAVIATFNYWKAWNNYLKTKKIY